jgi:hypothetical protein
MQVDQQTRALLTAIVQEHAAGDGRVLADLAGRIADWDALIQIAREHRLLPLLFHRLDAAKTPLPPAVETRLRAESDRNTFHSLANAAELIALVEAFKQENIPVIPFKGLVLAASAYRNPTLRSAGDLDLLIFERDLPRATALVRARGYELHTDVLEDDSPAIPEHYEFHFDRKTDGMVVELHWRLQLLEARYGSRFQRNLGMDWVWPRKRVAKVAGVDLPNLDPVATLLFLCMHGAKHRWSRMIWIYDLAQLLETTPDFDWKEVIEEAERKGVLRTLALGVLLAQRICRVALPERTLRRFRSDRTARLLAAYFEHALFETPGNLPPGSTPYSIRILDRKDRLKWMLKMEFLRPNERDRAFVRLPHWLWPVYFLVRPLRILFDRSPR